jgi:hypothetical protein
MFKCKMPSERALRNGGLLPVKEESGTVWLWMDPSLLGWSRPITWLFSPPLGSECWRGDLWGVDSSGELIVVESKITTKQQRCDPFGSLLGLETKERPKKRGLSVQDVIDRWERCYKQELQVAVDCNLEDKGTWPGILPYGAHRHALRYWYDLYQMLRRRIEDPSYPQTVRDLLQKRKRQKDRSAPYYFGFFTIGDDFGKTIPLRKLLTEIGCGHYAELKKKVGADHVRVAAACARANAHGNVRISEVSIKIEQ